MKVTLTVDFDSDMYILRCGRYVMRLSMEEVQWAGEHWYRQKIARFRRYARTQMRRVR